MTGPSNSNKVVVHWDGKSRSRYWGQKSGISFWGMWSLRYLLVIKWCWKGSWIFFVQKCSVTPHPLRINSNTLAMTYEAIRVLAPVALTILPPSHYFQPYETLCSSPCSFVCHVSPAWNVLSLIHSIPHQFRSSIMASYGKPSLTPQASRAPLPLSSNRAHPISVIIALTTLYSN